MSQLYSSPIFGPVHSRRLGISLGINLLPPDGKMCSFDCIYCECGLNADRHPNAKMPTRTEVKKALESTLQKMLRENTAPDVLTFAGNGEPTLHPQFPAIVNDVRELRDRYFPNCKISVLSNATQILKPKVFDALCLIDNNILKLDTVDENYIKRMDRPNSGYELNAIINQLKAFGNRCIIQTMFLSGSFQGKDMDNTNECFVRPWINTLCDIQPSMVMIYTIDRATPFSTLLKAAPDVLDHIASQVRQAGLNCQVSY